MNCDNHIVKTSAKSFNKFISSITKGLSRPKTKFTTELLCGIIFSGNLILTNIASKVPRPGRLTAIAKRFRRHLADSRAFLKRILFDYLRIVRRRLDIDSLFIVDISDIAKPYACLLYTSPSPRDLSTSRMPSSA